MNKHTTYVPPSRQMISTYAKSVCQQLAEREDNPVYLAPDVLDGFTQFVDVAARITAKYLSSDDEQLVDSDD